MRYLYVNRVVNVRRAHRGRVEVDDGVAILDDLRAAPVGLRGAVASEDGKARNNLRIRVKV